MYTYLYLFIYVCVYTNMYTDIYIYIYQIYVYISNHFCLFKYWKDICNFKDKGEGHLKCKF